MDSNQTTNILVLGGTGKVGQLVVKAALAKGYHVRSVTRNLKNAPKFPEGEVEWIEGSILDPVIADRAVQGQTAVISVLGPKGLKKTNLYSESAKIVTEAMKKHNVTRYLAITAGVANEKTGAFTKWLLKKLLKELRADSAIMEEYFTKSQDQDIEWTIVRPFPMKNAKVAGKYRVGAGDGSQMNPPLKPTTIRADLAEFLVKEAVEKNWSKQIVTLGL